MLHSPLNDLGLRTVFCVPTAICAITGNPLSQVHKAIRDCYPHARGRTIQGVPLTVARQVLYNMGWGMVEEGWMGKMRHIHLRNFVTINSEGGPYLAWNDDHALVTFGYLICDSFTQTPVRLFDAEMKIPSEDQLINGWVKLRRRK